jgi:SAM-dependent methyltransferase
MAERDVQGHYGHSDLARQILNAIRAAGLDPEQLSPDDLAPLEEFHTLGRRASEELAELAGVEAGLSVLDVGAGLGGPARLLASRYGCRVTAIDLTKDYCEISQLLTQATGLAALVEVRQGDALNLPFADESFDLVWTQHVSMNIADKLRMYQEVARVLAPGGRFAFFDVVAGGVSPIHFPVPWAADPSISFLETPEQMGVLLDEAGFTPVVWQDLTDGVLAWLEQRVASSPDQAMIGLHLLAPDMATKLTNQVHNVREGRVRFLRAVLTHP